MEVAGSPGPAAGLTVELVAVTALFPGKYHNHVQPPYHCHYRDWQAGYSYFPRFPCSKWSSFNQWIIRRCHLSSCWRSVSFPDEWSKLGYHNHLPHHPALNIQMAIITGQELQKISQQIKHVRAEKWKVPGFLLD